MKSRLLKLFLSVIVFSLAIAFVIKFGAPQVLRAYIQTGIGNCEQIPILCMAPQEIQPAFIIDKNYIAQELITLNFPKTKISIPRGFKAVQELVKKTYYKKKKPRKGEAVIYIIHQPPGYFIKLFPQVKQIGITDNYEFMHNLMYARESGINNLQAAFFVILKSIFTPDLGNQKTVEMIQFRFEEREYFINYNLSGPVNFFDCCIITKDGDFFKIYIKDIAKTLSLDKVFSILSTVNSA